MDRKRQQQIVRSRRRTPLTGVAVAWAGATALAVVASFAAVALGSGGTVTVGSVSSSKLGERVAVNAQGRTLYALSPETTPSVRAVDKTKKPEAPIITPFSNR